MTDPYDSPLAPSLPGHPDAGLSLLNQVPSGPGAVARMARGDEVAGGVVATVPVEVVDDENAPSDSLPPLDGRAAPVACVEAEADLLQEDGAMFEYKPDAASEWVPRQVQGSVTCHAPKVQVS